MGNYIFTFTPTFTQGLILGQGSILLLVYFILKYLFLDPKSAQLPEESSEEDAPFFRPSLSAEKPASAAFLQAKGKERDGERDGGAVESAEWLNVLLKQVSGRVPFRNGPGLTHRAWGRMLADRGRVPMQAACLRNWVGRREGSSHADPGPGERSTAAGTAGV